MMVCSITEGEEKPLKYPLMFRSGVERILASARAGQGVDEWREWLGKRLPVREQF
ncbi:MAG: hypothetical protein ACRDSJ_12950 [Rubrobacteraceae bacterium]